MKEVTDPQLTELRMTIQNMPVTDNANIQWRLFRAWEVTMLEDITIYFVEIVGNMQIVLRGILIWPIMELYLDHRSMLILIDERIQVQLDAFNAGKHWRYKGL